MIRLRDVLSTGVEGNNEDGSEALAVFLILKNDQRGENRDSSSSASLRRKRAAWGCGEHGEGRRAVPVGILERSDGRSGHGRVVSWRAMGMGHEGALRLKGKVSPKKGSTAAPATSNQDGGDSDSSDYEMASEEELGRHGSTSRHRCCYDCEYNNGSE